MKKLKTARRKSQRLLNAAYVASLAGIAFAVVFAVSSMAAKAGLDRRSAKEYFMVKQIRLSGLESVTQKEAMELIGISAGTNIFKFDLEEAGRRLESHGLVESVEIRREIPSTLLVKVRERKPEFIVRTGDESWLIDHSGVVVSRAERPSEAKSYVALSWPGLGRESIEMGKRIAREDLGEIMEAARRFENYRLFGKYRFSSLAALDRQRVVARFEDTSVTVTTRKKGWTDEMERLLTVDYILREKQDTALALDLTFAKKVVVKFAQTEEEEGVRTP